MKIITAKEFLEKQQQFAYIDDGGDKIYTNYYVIKNMTDFAKIHVKAALKEALESIPCLGSSSDIATYEEVEQAVLNCYPENLIK